MNAVLSKILSTGVFFLFILLTGFWLTRSGKPYHAVLFNIHKFIALGAIVYLVVTITKMRQAATLGPLEVIAIVAAGLLFIATMVTGGLWSITQPMPAIIRTGHHLLPYLTMLATAAVLYLLLQK